jgi:hypothetical protein
MIPRPVRLLPALLVPLAFTGLAAAQESTPPATPPAGPPVNAAAATRTPPPPPPVVPMRSRGGTPGERERVIQGADDVGPLSTAQWVDLRQDVDGGFGFGSVYRDGDLFMRSLGALQAIFPRSEYMSPRVGLSSARVPAGTRFQIGEPVRNPEWQPRPDMRNGRISGPMVPAGPLAIAAVGQSDGAVRVDPFAPARVVGTGLVNDPVVVRQRMGIESAGPLGAIRVDEHGRPLAEAGAGPGADAGTGTADPDADPRTANRPSDASLPERRRTGAASPPRLSSTPMPAIVGDREYRRSRLRAILDRALAGARSSR